jgi:hypothetical protein
MDSGSEDRDILGLDLDSQVGPNMVSGQELGQEVGQEVGQEPEDSTSGFGAVCHMPRRLLGDIPESEGSVQELVVVLCLQLWLPLCLQLYYFYVRTAN